MKLIEDTYKDHENYAIHYYKWVPEVPIKGIIQISHGMAETAIRYERFAEFLTEEGYIVYANDHRGHGKTAGIIENIGYLGENDGFQLLVDDMHELTTIIKNENPNVLFFLFGHSMGSFLCQRYVQLYGNEINGVILSGTNGKQGFILNLGIIISRIEIILNGRKSRSIILNNMSFGGYNKNFKPTRTEFDWLSRDTYEVDKYINDKFCGGIFTASFFHDLFNGLKKIEKLSSIASIPKNLPFYIFSGTIDPVGNFTKGVLKLIDTYEKQGMKDITYKFYPDGRHEMLHELNYMDVIKDTIKWLNSKCRME
ncbi:MAG: lysophospholipase [Solirubrobacterales bacterium]